jgi:hypothetical protein
VSVTDDFNRFVEKRDEERAEEARVRITFRKATLRFSEGRNRVQGYVGRIGKSETRVYYARRDDGTYEWGDLIGKRYSQLGTTESLAEAKREAKARLRVRADHDAIPSVRLGTLSNSPKAVFHVIVGDGEFSWEAVAACGAKGTLANLEEGVDARAFSHRGRAICQKCRTLATERRPTPEAPPSSSRPSVGRDVPGDPKEGGEQMPATRKTTSGSRKRTARSSSASKATKKTTTPKKSTQAKTTRRTIRAADVGNVTAPEAQAPAEATPDEIRKSLVDALKAIEGAVVFPNKDNRFDRYTVLNQTFGLVFTATKSGVPLQIPRPLLVLGIKTDVEARGFAEKKYGFSRTIKTAADVVSAAEAFAIAAAAVRAKVAAKQDEAQAQDGDAS